MTESIQFIQTTPQQIEESILKGVKSQIDQLRADFQPKQPTEYLTRNEVSNLLSIDLSTIHHWCKNGKLKPYGIGARVYFKRHEVEESLIPLF